MPPRGHSSLKNLRLLTVKAMNSQCFLYPSQAPRAGIKVVCNFLKSRNLPPAPCRTLESTSCPASNFSSLNSMQSLTVYHLHGLVVRNAADTQTRSTCSSSRTEHIHRGTSQITKLFRDQIYIASVAEKVPQSSGGFGSNS